MNLEFRFLSEEDRERWNRFVSGCEMGSIFQSCEWSIEMERRGWTADFPAVEEDGEIVAGAAVYSQKIPLLNRTVINIPNGPLWKDGKEDALGNLLDDLVKYAGSKKAIFIDCQAYLPCGPRSDFTKKLTKINGEFLSRNFKKMAKTDGTYLVDLRRDEEKIFENFSKNHRRDIRKGEREGVIIGSSNGSNARELSERFYRYYADTFRRKGLVPLHEEFFLKGLPNLVSAGRCMIFFAEYEKSIYNMAVISLLGIPTYIWGASVKSSDVPPTGQLLQWEIIRWLKRNGYETYNLGGSPGDIPGKGHPNYWVWRFKKGFSGLYVDVLYRYTYVFNKSLYFFYRKLVPVYRRFFSGK